MFYHLQQAAEGFFRTLTTSNPTSSQTSEKAPQYIQTRHPMIRFEPG